MRFLKFMLMLWIFFCNDLVAQTDSLITTKFSPRRVYFNVYLTPTFSTIKREPGKELYGFSDHYGSYYYHKNNNRTGTGFSFGLNSSVGILRSLRINSGIEYNILRTKTGMIDTLYHSLPGIDLSNENGFIFKKVINRSRAEFLFATLSVPVKAEYFFASNKVLFYSLGLGFTSDLVIRQSAVIYYYDTISWERDTHHHDIYSLGNSFFRYRFFLNVCGALNCAISKKGFVSLKPFFRYQVGNESAFNKDSFSSGGNTIETNRDRLYYFGIHLVLNL